jgi:hypothetical protein
MKPSVGRIVHYVSYGTPGGEFHSECRAAIIAAVPKLSPDDAAQKNIEQWAEEADLVVFNPTGLFFNLGCVQSEYDHRGGTWHWPERVE